MLASRADLGAATDGVPGGIGPFDVGVEGHYRFPLLAEVLKNVRDDILRRIVVRREK
jgi:hypothetical protein